MKSCLSRAYNLSLYPHLTLLKRVQNLPIFPTIPSTPRRLIEIMNRRFLSRERGGYNLLENQIQRTPDVRQLIETEGDWREGVFREDSTEESQAMASHCLHYCYLI